MNKITLITSLTFACGFLHASEVCEISNKATKQGKENFVATCTRGSDSFEGVEGYQYRAFVIKSLLNKGYKMSPASENIFIKD